MGAQMAPLISEDLVKKTNAVFSFSLSDQKTTWFLDLKNGAGSCGKGSAASDVDATLSMTSNNFQKMFSGQLKPTTAFMSGRLKISGNMGKAMKLEKLMGQMQKRSYSTGPADPIEEVFTKINGVLSEDLVKKTDSVFSFSLTDTKTEYFLDLKNGSGSCGQGKSPAAADATLSMSSGNMGKAMKLEKLMGQLQKRGYHTMSSRGKA